MVIHMVIHHITEDGIWCFFIIIIIIRSNKYQNFDIYWKSQILPIFKKEFSIGVVLEEYIEHGKKQIQFS